MLPLHWIANDSYLQKPEQDIETKGNDGASATKPFGLIGAS